MNTTTFRENRVNISLWVFVTKGGAIFHTARSNNHEVALEILGEHNGTRLCENYF